MTHLLAQKVDRWELIRLRQASARQVVESPELRDLAWLESRSYDFRVSTVDEIKKAAGALSVNEREELLSWLLDADDEWDRQMAKDAASGKLDFLIEEARTAVREESLRDWPKPKI